MRTGASSSFWPLVLTIERLVIFSVCQSQPCVVTKQVCLSIVECLLPKYINIQTGAALTEDVEGFRVDHGFPQCLGAVDGTHIPILSPQDFPADYYNRKGWHSIILQGVVDHKGGFIDVYVGWPGRVHDARVFANSSLYQRGQSNTLFPNCKESIAGKEVSLVLLGDPAYPLLPWLMKPFPNNGRLSREQKTFNYSPSKARVVVEHCYGRLKGRWRCLLKRLDVDVSDSPTLITACCVLHIFVRSMETHLMMNGLMEWSMKISAPVQALLNQQKMQQISAMPLCHILATKTLPL